MRWSKFRRLVLDRFAPALQGRLDLHSAAYGRCSCGHAWMTYDGRVIANFCTRTHAIAQGYETTTATPNAMYLTQAAGFGEWSRQNAYRSCWAFVHDLSVEQALAHADPLVRALAIADGRVGRRRLALVDEGEHALVRLIAAFRRRPAGAVGISANGEAQAA